MKMAGQAVFLIGELSTAKHLPKLYYIDLRRVNNMKSSA